MSRTTGSFHLLRRVTIPVWVIAGENSEAFFHEAAKQLAGLLTQAEHYTLAGQDHSAVMMAPDVLAKVIAELDLKECHAKGEAK